MDSGLVLLFFLLLATVVSAAYLVVVECYTGTTARRIYLILVAACAILAYRMTFHFAYSPDSNTRIHGFPIPVVVFQRQDAASEWADFVGPTVILGLPMNLVVYLFPISLIFLVVAGLKRWRLNRQVSKPGTRR